MENLIYVTSIENVNTNELLHVFIDPKTKEKLISREKYKYVPVDNIYIKRLLNNNIETQNKKIYKTAIVLGSSIIFTSFLISSPTANDILDTGISIIKNKTHLSYSTYEYNNIDSFIKRLRTTIGNNDEFNYDEKYTITNGLADFFKDWGYLYNSSELNGIIYRLQKVKVHRKGTISRNASGEYIFLNINLDKDATDLTTAHEVFHCVFDVTKTDALEELMGFGSSYREAIVESLNNRYMNKFSKDNTFTYTEQKKDLVKLSLLVDSEKIMEKFLLESISIVDLIKEECKDIQTKDIIKYVSLLDAKKQLYNNRYAYKLVDSAKYEEEELYNKMYKSKYGKDFEVDVLLSEDFLNKNIEFSKDGFRYSLSREMFNTVELDSYEDLKNTIIGLDHSKESEELLLYLSDYDIREQYKNNINGYIDYLYNKYSESDTKLLKFINLLHIDYNSFNDYFDMYFDELNNRNLEPYLYALELKEGLKSFNKSLYIDENYNCDITELMKSMLELKLKKEQSREVLYWFSNTDLEFIVYDYFNKENCVVKNRYNVRKGIPVKIYNGEVITYLDKGYKDIYLNQEKAEVIKLADYNNKYSDMFNKEDVDFYKVNINSEDSEYLNLFEEKYEYTPSDMLRPYGNNKIKKITMN